jgi:hypothetical protein
MGADRWLVFALAALLGASLAQAAELPAQSSQAKKPKQAEAAKTCNVAGVAGVLLANGVCVRMSGYISSQFTGGQIK